MNLTARILILALVIALVSCINRGTFSDKKDWDYYGNLGGNKGWKLYRNEWTMNTESTKLRSNFLEIYKFKENERIASIGASMGIFEIWYAKNAPKLDFYLEDINPAVLNEAIFKDVSQKLDSIYPQKVLSQFHIAIGDEKATHLPDAFFDKIIIEKTLHEFTYPDEMLRDISQKLTQRGTLYIAEVVEERVKKRVWGCRHLTETQIVLLLRKNRFQLIRQHFPYAPFDRFRIFEFKKITNITRK